MSHTATINLEIKNIEAFLEACRDLGYAVRQYADVKLFDGSVYKDCIRVEIPGWRYPVAVKDGQLYYDNYNGAWGNQADLGKLKQSYARNTAIRTARARGFRVQETKLSNGTVQLKLSRM